MTIQQRANALMGDHFGHRWAEDGDKCLLWANLQAALREAVADERARCAALLRSLPQDGWGHRDGLLAEIEAGVEGG